MEGRRKPITQDSRNRKRAQLLKKRKQAIRRRVSFFVVLILLIIVGALLVKKYSPSKEQVNLNEYYGIANESDLAIVVDNRIVGPFGKMIDGKPYVEYSVVRDYLNGRFYVDHNENLLLYTLANGSIEAHVGSTEYTYQKETYSKEYVILKMDGNTTYIALDFVKEYTDIEFQTYENPARIMIQADWSESTIAVVKKDSKLRVDDDIKSQFIAEAKKKTEVTVIEKGDKWTCVRTEDGFIGYIQNSKLKDEQQIIVDRAFEKQEYPNISKKYTINMAWHMVEDRGANDAVLSAIASTKGLTTISPTWFMIGDTSGDLVSLASSDYVNYAHQVGLEVWALIKDFDGEVDTEEEMLELLSRTSSRTNLISELMSEVFKHDIDGINVDFENITAESAEHYLQFIRELSVKCRQNGIVLSVDNHVPASYNAYYNLEEQAEIVDYVIIMGYDEYHEESLESGPVASLAFVKSGIETALESVPKEKLINGVPFYTRIWTESPKEDGSIELTSEVYRMKTTYKAIEGAGAEVIIDPATGMNYAEWTADGQTYKVWIEDAASLEAKLQLMQQKDLAGVSAWLLGWESEGTWDLILKYVN